MVRCSVLAKPRNPDGDSPSSAAAWSTVSHSRARLVTFLGRQTFLLAATSDHGEKSDHSEDDDHDDDDKSGSNCGDDHDRERSHPAFGKTGATQVTTERMDSGLG